jgi:HSP20 family protein
MAIIVRRNGGEGAIVPFSRPIRLLDDIETLAREMWEGWRPFTFEQAVVPYTDIYEEKDALVMKTELPGVHKKDFDISIEGDRLTIKAEKKEEVKDDATRHTHERYYGQYFRSVTLPYPVKEDEITATFENGVLEVRLPKGEEVKARKIEIKSHQLPGGKTARRQRKTAEKKS